MKKISAGDISESIKYPKGTARLKKIGEGEPRIKVALCGDSTIDNGHWVNKRSAYLKKQDTVAHQTAVALARSGNVASYDLANFAVDGATTKSMLQGQWFNQVIPVDADHPREVINQLEAIRQWTPDVAVLSVGGNNFRVAFQTELPPILVPGLREFGFTFKNICSLLIALCRLTPRDFWARQDIQKLFTDTQTTLYNEYKQIIDDLVDSGTTKRLIISSQYYPALTPTTSYFIYTGFAHLAHAQGKGQSPFQVADDILHDFYQEVLVYAASKNIEVIFADVTSSMSPLGGNLFAQIEPNQRGAQVLGKLMANAIEFEIPEDKKDSIPMISLNQQQAIEVKYLDKASIQTDFTVKTVEDFIQQDRYRHIELLFAKDTFIMDRLVCFYELLAGKQFDNEYTGLFAFGFFDLSLVTIAASYMWRMALNEQMHASLRIMAGILSGPILIIKHLTALLMVLSTLLTMLVLVQFVIFGFSLRNYVSQCFEKVKKEEILQPTHAHSFWPRPVDDFDLRNKDKLNLAAQC